MSDSPHFINVGYAKERSKNPSIHRSARIAYYAAAISLVLITILHGVKNELVPASHMVSEYAIGHNGWIMKLSFFAWSLSCISLGIAIRPHLKTKGGKVGLVFLFIAGLALVMGGIFVIDSPYAEIKEPTLHGSLHGLSAMLGLPGQAIAALLISYSLKRNPNWVQHRKPVILFAHLTWISLILMFASTFIMMSQSNGQFNGDTGIGWFNRLLILIYCTWLMILSVKCIEVTRKTTARNF